MQGGITSVHGENFLKEFYTLSNFLQCSEGYASLSIRDGMVGGFQGQIGGGLSSFLAGRKRRGGLLADAIPVSRKFRFCPTALL